MENTEHKDGGNGSKTPHPEELKDINLTITMSPNGKISVTGPIQNKPFCYGVLETAKDIIRAYMPGKKTPNIITPGGELLNRSGFRKLFRKKQ